MWMRQILGTVLATLPVLFVRCASVSPKRAYTDVASRVEQRGAKAPPWDTLTPEDATVGLRVRALLQQPLTLDGAVQVALLKNRRLVAVYQSLGVAQAELVQAGLLANPTFGGSIGFPLRGSPHTALMGSITENFLNLFALPLRKRLAARQLEQAKLQVGAAVMEMNADVQEAFYRAQAAQQRTDLWRTLVSAEGASSELASRQYRAGNISELEESSRQASYEQMRLELTRAENEALDAREALNRLMGVWGGDTAWKAAGSLPGLPPFEGHLEQLESLAVGQRMDLAAAHAETEATLQTLQLVSGTRFLTSLGVGIQAERDSEGNKLAGPTVSLELPLFDQHQAQVARLAANARFTRAQEEALEVDIRSQVRGAQNHLLASRVVVEHYRSVLLPLRARIVALSQRHYNAMLLGVYGLILAKQNEVNAARDYIDAVRDYWVARSELERAVGGRLSSQRTP